MAINERLIDTKVEAAGNGGAGTGNQEEGLILHLDANDVDSYDGDGSVWYDITNHEYTPATNVSEHFNTVTYSGNNSTKVIDTVGFQPDLVWIKNRTNANSHNLFDSIRGATKVIYSNLVNDQDTRSNSLTSFDSDGFSLSDYVGVNGGYNYVAWCFKAGGAPTATNTGGQTPTSGSKMVDGTAVTDNYPTADIYPTKQSVNTKLGFSVTEYTGAGSNKSLPHGLDVPPQMYIIKRTSSDQDWWVFTTEGGDFQYLRLNETSAVIDADQYYARPTGSIIAQGNSGTNIMYAFASKRGVSKVGSFEGTGAAGNKVYTGFEPAFIMMKRSSTSGSGWYMIDNKRSTDSDKNDYLDAHINSAEATSGSGVTFNRDGFTFTGASFNTNGATHIYYAVAKNTNETSLIPDTDLELHLDADSFPQYGEAGYSNTPSTWTALTGSNGTISGATFDSELGNWLDFDGANDYVQTSYNPTGLSSLTIEYWINTDAVGGAESLGVVFFNGGGRIDISINSNSNNTPTASSNVVVLSKTDFIGNWNHVTIVLSGLASTYNTGGSYASAINASIYYNGEFINTVNPTPYQTPVLGVRVGRSGGGYYFNGKVGQVRCYSNSLTQDQIRQNYNFTKPSYPNGNNGTLVGLTSSDWNSSGYFDFNGNPSNTKVVTLNSDFGYVTRTWQAWVNPDVIQRQYIFSTYGTTAIGISTGAAYIEMQSNGTIQAGVRVGSTQSVTSTTSLTAGNWSHISITIDSSSLKLYINGNLEGTTSFTFTSTASNSQNLVIGYEVRNNNHYWNGKMSDIKVFDRALSAAEVTAQFAIKQFDIG